MSTRSRIGIRNQNGSITSIYCHHDGYPDGVGEVLLNNYKTEEKIRQLLSLGDLSSIGTEPIDNPRAWERPKLTGNIGDWAKQWAEINPDNMCNSYRSRGEDVPARTNRNINGFLKLSKDCWAEYVYLFEKDGTWKVLEYGGEDFRPLAEVLAND